MTIEIEITPGRVKAFVSVVALILVGVGFGIGYLVFT